MMKEIIFFGMLSIPIIVISWRSLFTLQSHGFYRFFAWEAILWLTINNWRYWFADPLSIKQLISWLLLLAAGYLIIAGILVFKRTGKIDPSREDKNLLGFEKTTELIDTGIYKYIRHPLYASLLYLTWGIFFKNTNPGLLIVSVISSVFLYLTSRYDEKECLSYFGDKYRQYMSRSRMFLPFIF
jgi:protein-S-isoprenylcysteine O-methyltransferase Ste14